jgi:putative endonuclease
LILFVKFTPDNIIRAIMSCTYKDKRHQYGADAENQVADKYLEWGYELVSKRYRTPYGELDLIMKKDHTLIFIEVKARNDPNTDEYISKTQIKRNCNAANFFLYTYDYYQNHDVRFDLAVVSGSEIYDIIENAWVSDGS